MGHAIGKLVEQIESMLEFLEQVCSLLERNDGPVVGRDDGLEPLIDDDVQDILDPVRTLDFVRARSVNVLDIA
jgi:hypothetical protein